MLNELLYQNLDVYQVIKLKDIYGNTIQYVVLKYDDVKCRRNAIRNTTKTSSNGIIKILPNTYKIYIDTILNIREKDVIVLNNEYYDILHVYKISNYTTDNHLQIIARKVLRDLEDIEYLLHEDNDLILTENTNEYIIVE